MNFFFIPAVSATLYSLRENIQIGLLAPGIRTYSQVEADANVYSVMASPHHQIWESVTITQVALQVGHFSNFVDSQTFQFQFIQINWAKR